MPWGAKCVASSSLSGFRQQFLVYEMQKKAPVFAVHPSLQLQSSPIGNQMRNDDNLENDMLSSPKFWLSFQLNPVPTSHADDLTWLGKSNNHLCHRLSIIFHLTESNLIFKTSLQLQSSLNFNHPSIFLWVQYVQLIVITLALATIPPPLTCNKIDELLPIFIPHSSIIPHSPNTYQLPTDGIFQRIPPIHCKKEYSGID